MSRRLLRAVGIAAVIVCAATTTACGRGSPIDKAGASEPPVTLRLATPESDGTPDSDALRQFADEVARLSDGRITVDLVWNAIGAVTDYEDEIVAQVRDGNYDLGSVGTRDWDRLGIVAFSALQAPFLIDDYETLDAVMTSDLPDRMLSELDDIGLVGIALWPDQLRHPQGLSAPLKSLADFAGIGFRVPPSQVSDALISALGATPVHKSGAELLAAIDDGEVAGVDTSLGFAPGTSSDSYLTMNLTFYPKVLTLFAESARYATLSSETRSVIETAAQETLTFLRAQDFEVEDLATFCELGGTIVEAEPNDVEAIVQVAQSVTRQLESDETVAQLIAEIRALHSPRKDPVPVEQCDE